MREPQGESCSRDHATREVGPPVELNAAPLEAGTSIGRYVITGTAGEGGMGVVYRVYDPRLRREVALKRLRSRLSKGAELDATSKSRLLAEARAMAALSHPNVLPVYDVEMIDDDLCVTMEYVEGVTLRQWRRHNDPSWYHIVDELIEAGEGLAAAHRAGLVHRDFKPTNAMIGADGRVRVMDFGLATRRSDAESASIPALASATSATADDPEESEPKTEEGVVMGTPAYMSPEQHDGLPADARSDQYAFCVSAFELLYGRRPFAAKGAKALARAKREGKIRRIPSRSGVPRSIHRILVRGMAPEPALRWPSMDVLLAQLRRARAWRRRKPLMVVGSLLTVAAAAYALGPSAVCRPDDEMAAVWNDARAQRIAAALAVAEVPAVDEQWPRMQRRIDGYAARWMQAFRDNCESAGSLHRASPEYRGRKRCLEDRLRSLDAVLRVIEGADRQMAVRVHLIVSGLPGIDECGPDARGFAEIAPPDPAVAADIDRILSEATEAESLAAAGRARDALRILQSLVARARNSGYEPALARVLAGLARTTAEIGDYEEAVVSGREAYLLALASGDDAVAVSTALSIAHALAEGLHRPEDATDWVDQAQALVERARLPAHWQGRVALSRGTVLHAAGDSGRARDALAQAIQLLDDAEGSGQAMARAHAHHELGRVYRDLGQIEPAMVQFETARRIQSELFGPTHPLDGSVIIDLAMAKAELGDHAGALLQLEQALDAYERGYGADSWPAIMARGDMGDLLVKAGRADEADGWYARMESGLQRHRQTRGSTYAQLQAKRARLAARRGDREEARRRWDLAIDGLGELGGFAAEADASLRLDHARFVMDDGEPERAEVMLAAVERELLASVGEHDPLTIRIRIARADALLRMEQHQAALETLQPLLVIAETTPDLPADALPWIRFLLAQALWKARPSQRDRAHLLMVGVSEELDAHRGLAPELGILVARWLELHTAPARSHP